MKRILVIGGYTLDKIVFRGSVEERVGGPPYYIAKILAGLDLKLYIISRVGRNFPKNYLEGICGEGVECIVDYADMDNIRFTNILEGDKRIQYVDGGGYLIDLEYISSIGKVDYIIVSPVLNEVDINSLASIAESYNLAVDPQGFLRRVSRDGRVYLSDVNPSLFKNVSILKPSLEEFKILRRGLNELIRNVRGCILVTNGIRGAYLLRDEVTYIPSKPVYNVDSTGAGDMFLGFFIYRLIDVRDYVKSAASAAAAVSLILRGLGRDLHMIDRLTRELIKESYILSYRDFIENIANI